MSPQSTLAIQPGHLLPSRSPELRRNTVSMSFIFFFRCTMWYTVRFRHQSLFLTNMCKGKVLQPAIKGLNYRTSDPELLVGITVRPCCDVSSELCCHGVKLRRWTTTRSTLRRNTASIMKITKPVSSTYRSLWLPSCLKTKSNYVA